jgi:two-component system nitrate/nitrite response regulator NarL
MAIVRVLVADDHPLFREAVVATIRACADLELVAEVADGRDALREVTRLRPDVAVLDVRMPGLEGPEVIRELATRGIETRMLLLSAYRDGALVERALTAGAAGYLSKGVGGEAICDAVQAIARGERIIGPDVAEAVRRQVRRDSAQLAPLTSREREVMVLVAEGRSAPDIARRLFLSTATVKSHLKNIYAKLGVSDRAAAVAEAIRAGILQ